jgi:hypothetical protein
MALELPNRTTLPYWVIFTLCAAIGVLYGRIIELERDCDAAIKEERQYWEQRFADEQRKNEELRREMIDFVTEQRAKYDELLLRVRTQ